MYLNKVLLLGRVVRDPELRWTSTSKAVCQFSLAVGWQKDNTEFFNCEAWEKQAETIAEHVDQGQELFVEGRLRTDSWEKDGQKHQRTKVVVERTSFGPKKSRVPGEDDAPSDSIKGEEPEEENVPF
jgi:single-strand DNA-binding protein